MSRIKAVLFDFDGTIMDTNAIILSSWKHTFNTVLGVDPDKDAIVASFGEPLEETMRKFFPGRDTERMVETYRNYQRSIYKEEIRMFPGCAETMQELKRRGFKLGVVTSRLWSSTRQGLYKFGMEHLLDAVVSAEDTDIHKPDPEPCLLCLRRLQTSADEAIMVGDSAFDILCARNAGVKSALVSWSISVSEKQRRELAPDHYIQKASDILDIAEMA